MRLSCGDDGRVIVECMGQLRLGVGDLGVNAARNTALLQALRSDALSGRFARGACEGSIVGAGGNEASSNAPGNA